MHKDPETSTSKGWHGMSGLKFSSDHLTMFVTSQLSKFDLTKKLWWDVPALSLLRFQCKRETMAEVLWY
jgi:hypothetical protein